MYMCHIPVTLNKIDLLTYLLSLQTPAPDRVKQHTLYLIHAFLSITRVGTFCLFCTKFGFVFTRTFTFHEYNFS